MKRNGGKKNTAGKRTANGTAKKSFGNNAKKIKAKKTNSGHAANDGRLQKNEIDIYKELLKSSGQRFRKDEIKKIKREELAELKQRKQIAKRFNVPLKRVTSGSLYDNIDSYDKLKAVIKRDGQLRYKGKFITKEAQDKILEFAKTLDKQGVEFNLNEILKVPQVEKKILIIKNDKIAKFQFYWNLQNKIHDNEFGTPIIIIKDYEGKEVFNNRSKRKEVNGVYKDAKTHKAVGILNDLNKRLENLEKLIEESEDVTPYFTVPTFDLTRDGEIIKIIIDYSGVEGRLPEDIFNKYKQLL